MIKEDDLIYRNEAIDALIAEVEENGHYRRAIRVIKNLPSAQQEPCEDAVSREAAIKCCTFGRTSLGLIDELRRLPSVTPKEQRWIPCSERPPEEGRDVLITKESFEIKGYEQNVIKAKRSVDPRSGKIEWWSPEFGTLANKAVLAWMPLPEPYRKESKEV